MRENEKLSRYRMLMEQRQYQDRLFWSRVQTLYVLQAAVLGGSFALQDKWYYGWATLLLIFGSFLTTLIGLLCCYDWQDARVNEKEFFRLGDELKINWGAKHHHIRRFLSGNRILELTIVGFVWLDLVLGSYFLWLCAHVEMQPKVIIYIVVLVCLVLGSVFFHAYWNRDVEKPDPLPFGTKELQSKGRK